MTNREIWLAAPRARDYDSRFYFPRAIDPLAVKFRTRWSPFPAERGGRKGGRGQSGRCGGRGEERVKRDPGRTEPFKERERRERRIARVRRSSFDGRESEEELHWSNSEVVSCG